MIDDLDLPFDEIDHRARHRRRHAAPSNTKKKKKKKKKRGRSGLALVLTLMLLVCLGGGVFFAYQKLSDKFSTPDYAGKGTGEVVIVIKPGDLGTDMAETLKAADVVKSEKAFKEAYDANPQAKSIQPGTYKLRKQMSAEAALLMLLDPLSRLVSGVTVPEGLSSFKIFKLLAKELKLPEADFKAAAADPLKLDIPEWWFNRQDGKKSKKSIEGFLYPDTYEFPENVTAKGALEIMVKRFLDVTSEMDFVKRVEEERKIVSPYEALIVASLAQAEAGRQEDLGRVARVAYNRIFHPSDELGCACLQFDVTVNYSRELRGLEPNPSKGLTEAELTDPKNPYNRNAEGLVPTPINNPGKAALEAAMTPPDGDWYFFVAVDKEGTTKFSKTYNEFCRDKREAVQNGVLDDASC